MTSEPGSFARKTIVERKPQIIREVSQAHPYPPEIQAALRAFAAEIASQPVQRLREAAPDVGLWNGAWAAFEGRTWLDLPWYFAETFFYRRLMEVVRYYQPGPWREVDPFAPQKAAQLDGALASFRSLLALPEVPDPERAFTVRMYDALWGNRADLSNRTIAVTADRGLASRQNASLPDQQTDRLLIDDTPRIWRYLVDRAPACVHVVADNSGLELLLDLRLADCLLQRGHTVRFHLKRMPFFVSDAMLRDLQLTMERLAAAGPPGTDLVARLRAALSTGALSLHDDPFWSTCLSYHDIPEPVRGELAAADLVLFKGDVNYRRLLDDRHWPHTAHLADIARNAPRHVPSPFVTLRTLKGELIVDLEPGQAEALAARDPTWMINGERGVVQYVEPGGR
jgi:uncharacterized protein with ATP-grasp and redox domains